MNYMKEVAQLLGVELGEEFRIDFARAKHRITERGLEFFSEVDDAWLLDCLTLRNLLCGEYEIVKTILTDEEKEYLSAVIKPFRNCVKCISKNRFDGFERIFITYFSKLENKYYFLDLPAFEEGTMYKGMELCKHYTLEELNI